MQPKCRRRHFRQAGVTLVETLIAVAISLGVTLAAFTYLNNVQEVRTMMTRVTTRDAIAKRIETQMGSFRNIQFSGLSNGPASAGNIALKACLDGAPSPCTITGSANQKTFKFFVDQGAAGAIQLAGTDAEPVLYDYNGRPNCISGENGCPAYEARAYFWAACPSTGPCPRATQVSVRHQVIALKPMANGQTIPNMPPEPAFSTRKSAFSTTHFVRDKPSTIPDEVCVVGAQRVGSHSNGKIKCECSFANQTGPIDPLTQNPIVCIPSATECDKDEVINGIDNDGTPKCCAITTTCGWKSFANNAAGCGAGAWLEKLDMGLCSAPPPGKGKSTSGEISCDQNRGYCCSFKIGACK